MASGGSGAEQQTTQTIEDVSDRNSAVLFKVEFWVFVGEGSPPEIVRGWKLHDVFWAERWQQIPQLVCHLENLGGIWNRTRLQIEEHKPCINTGYFLPVLRN